MNFEELGRKVKKFSRDTVEEVQKMNEVRQLNGKVNDTQKQINALYTEMGKKLYEQYKEAALTGFESEIQSISEKYFRIQELKEQIRGVKGVVLCPCCNMEVSAAERFCSNCGNKMPEIFEIAEDEEMAGALEVDSEDVTETAEKAETVVEDTVEKVSEAAGEAAEKAEAVVEDTAEKVSEAVGEAAEKAETVVEDTAEKVSEAAQTAADKAEDVLETAGTKISEAAHAAADKVEDMLP